ncbi:hypothetical protein Cantr_06859 [Candida viswanathii]|uniref:Uncharacterized protein n=1 Tax=Candida viswanathii TaxID=5486 RepID=A0A367XVQ2_9ASCO|nr:hypothetical protein Cantr_06859 [Candida viswanathii]
MPAPQAKARRKDREVDVPVASVLGLKLSPFSSLSPAISTSTWSSQLDQELSEDVKRITKSPALHEELTRDLVLTQSTSMLGISRFELRLLQFFDKECTTLLAFGIPTIENAWKYGVPGLFLESELTRLAIFSFSAMTLLSMVDLNLALQTDAAEDERSLARLYNIDVNNPNNMFTQSISYFMDTISKKKSLLDQVDSPSFQDPKIAKELTVASILIFSYLALDPNRLIPVIDFTESLLI